MSVDQPNASTEPLLEVRGLVAEIGGVPALTGVNLEIHAGEIVALLGPNSSGKTTTLRAIMGLVAPARGTVEFRGAPLAGIPVEQRARLGVAYLPEGRRVFPGLSVQDNLAVACDADPEERRRRIDDIVELFFPLKERIKMPAWRLSGGLQQMTAIGRALMSDPLVMMLDEPSVGLAPAVLRDVLGRLRKVAERGTAILLAEQNAAAALAIADRAYVLDRGAVIAEGLAADFLIDSARQTPSPTLTASPIR
ncbi:MAG TPA: ATP-binding cassette domain-containing protein [Alphaproteobacteria bacterium]